MKRILLSILSVTALGLQAQNLCFDPANDNRYETGGQPIGVASADFDNDGKRDVVTSNFANGNISFFKGNGDGTFQAAVFYSVGALGPEEIVVGDFNSDTKPDVVTHNRDANDISLLVNNGAGGFNAAVTFAYGTNASSAPAKMATADFNADTKTDLVINDYADNRLYILKSNGNSTFTVTDTLLTGVHPVFINTGDLNGDNKPEIVVDYATGNAANDSISYFVNNGSGLFGNRTSLFVINFTTERRVPIIADLNGDNINDIICHSITDLQPFINNGALSFSKPAVLFTGQYSSRILVTDVNSDTKVDIINSSEDQGGVTVQLGNGNGTFQSYNVYTANGSPNDMLLADFDGDTRKDAVCVHRTKGYISFLKGQIDGSFGPYELRTALRPKSIAVGLLNSDAYEDLVVCNTQSPRISIMLGNSDGTFQTTISDSCYYTMQDVVLADFNNDTKLDAAAVGAVTNVLKGDGTGHLIVQGDINHGFGIGGEYFAVTGKFNSDNNVDIAIASNNSDSISVMLGNGDFTFAAPVKYGVGDGPKNIEAYDMNADGRLDLLVPNDLSNTVSILLGNANGTFQTPQNVSVGSGPRDVVAADFNHDGKKDFACVNNNSANITVHLATTVMNFAAGVPYTIGGASSEFMALGYITPDTLPDIILNGWPNNILMLQGNINGTFQSYVNYAGEYGVQEVLSSDFNNDGAGDIAAVNLGTNSVTVILNNSSFITAAGPTTICQGDSVMLSASNGYTYLWNTGETTASIYADAAGSYSCSVTNQSGTCTLVPPSVTVTTAGAVPNVQFTINSNDHVCISTGNVNLSMLGGSPQGGSYTGSFVSNGLFDAANAGAGPHVVSYAYTDPGGCGTGSASDTVFVDTEVLASITLPSDTFCAASSAVNLISYGLPAGGEWLVDNVHDTIFDPQQFGVGSGTFVRYITFNGACKDTATEVLSVISTVIASLNPADDSVCINRGAVLLNSGSPSGGFFEGTGISNNYLEPSIAGAGPHSVTYVYNIYGCADTAYGTITVMPKPTAQLSLPFDTICNGTMPITLSGGSPAGGYYGGQGVQAGVLDASSLSAGTHYLGYAYTDGNGCTDTVIKSFYVAICTGINDINNSSVQLYPNPNNGRFLVRWDITEEMDELKILDLSGRVIYRRSIAGAPQAELNMDQPKGVYVLQLSGAKGNSRTRFVIQ
ncbi:MAG: T9SS type A sorting domain-containing protein [Chitinophagales bacterium]